MKRITKVYTKTGDTGLTSLVDGSRVGKASARVSAYGDVDELNSLLGLVRIELLEEIAIFQDFDEDEIDNLDVAEIEDDEIDIMLDIIQNALFVLGADLASPLAIEVPRIDNSHIEILENSIDEFLEQLEPLKEFILPGGIRSGAMLHLARTVARRAERTVVDLASKEEINPQSIIYLNRLSDWLFVAARIANKRGGIPEQSANFSRRQ